MIYVADSCIFAVYHKNLSHKDFRILSGYPAACGRTDTGIQLWNSAAECRGIPVAAADFYQYPVREGTADGTAGEGTGRAAY